MSDDKNDDKDNFSTGGQTYDRVSKLPKKVDKTKDSKKKEKDEEE